MSTSSTSLASNRINSLLDENSFVEIGSFVSARNTDFNMKETNAPGDGVITGYGVINDILVYVYSQDVSVLKGSIGEMHAKKIVNLYDLALKTGAPVIGLIDSAGLRLQEATDALNAFGEIYKKQVMLSGVVPQITAILGSCGGGLGVMSALSDFTFMETKKGKLFVNSPNALKGNTIEKCDTSSATFQGTESGLADVVADETTIYEKIRELISMLPANNEDDMSYVECTDDLNRSCPELAALKNDAAAVLATISDDQAFFELKTDYAKEMVTAFIRLNGMTVGAVANRSEMFDEEGKIINSFNSELTVEGCEKAAEFIKFCDAFEIPVLSLTNVDGFEATLESEKRIAKSVAKLIYAFADASVPKVNVIVGKAFGSAYVAMNAKAIGADITIAWEDSKIGMMDAKIAAQIICEGEGSDKIDAYTKEYQELQTSSISAARRGYVDQIIETKDTRKYVIGAFEMLFTKREERPAKKHGTI